MAAPTPEQQAVLDAQWDKIADKVASRFLTIVGNKMPVSLITNQPMTVVDMLQYIDGHVSAIDSNTAAQPSRVDGSPLTSVQAALWADKHASDVAIQIDTLSAKVDAILAAIEKKA